MRAVSFLDPQIVLFLVVPLYHEEGGTLKKDAPAWV